MIDVLPGRLLPIVGCLLFCATFPSVFYLPKIVKEKAQKALSEGKHQPAGRMQRKTNQRKDRKKQQTIESNRLWWCINLQQHHLRPRRNECGILRYSVFDRTLRTEVNAVQLGGSSLIRMGNSPLASQIVWVISLTRCENKQINGREARGLSAGSCIECATLHGRWWMGSMWEKLWFSDSIELLWMGMRRLTTFTGEVVYLFRVISLVLDFRVPYLWMMQQ